MRETSNLWKRYKSQMDLEARQQIILTYAYLAKYVVDRMSMRPTAVVSYDDLVAHAIVGLIDAVEKFDPSRGIKFETYAVSRIRGAILDAVKSLDWIPRSVRASEQELRRVLVNLEAELGRPATDGEAAAAMGINVDQLSQILADVGQSAVLSLENLMAYGEEGAQLTGPSAQSNPEHDPVLAAELTERKRLLARAIESLPEREKLVISLYYQDGLTLKEIAAVLGVTESRACQLHSKAVVRLHGKLERHTELLLAAA